MYSKREKKYFQKIEDSLVSNSELVESSQTEIQDSNIGVFSILNKVDRYRNIFGIIKEQGTRNSQLSEENLQNLFSLMNQDKNLNRSWINMAKRFHMKKFSSNKKTPQRKDLNQEEKEIENCAGNLKSPKDIKIENCENSNEIDLRRMNERTSNMSTEEIIIDTKSEESKEKKEEISTNKETQIPPQKYESCNSSCENNHPSSEPEDKCTLKYSQYSECGSSDSKKKALSKELTSEQKAEILDKITNIKLGEKVSDCSDLFSSFYKMEITNLYLKPSQEIFKIMRKPTRKRGRKKDQKVQRPRNPRKIDKSSLMLKTDRRKRIKSSHKNVREEANSLSQTKSKCSETSKCLRKPKKLQRKCPSYLARPKSPTEVKKIQPSLEKMNPKNTIAFKEYLASNLEKLGLNLSELTIMLKESNYLKNACAHSSNKDAIDMFLSKLRSNSMHHKPEDLKLIIEFHTAFMGRDNLNSQDVYDFILSCPKPIIEKQYLILWLKCTFRMNCNEVGISPINAISSR
ncbi:unnamed protein product [Moneuplotes crassus]|uniref:Uncharacterized protein n=1 Tax=Euplotes crassus TaxID=5936 RepID=A0AAD1Y5N6_EUPCR|nr:unnamed protein product [Moneuplotes crassus]